MKYTFSPKRKRNEMKKKIQLDVFEVFKGSMRVDKNYCQEFYYF